MLYRFGPRRNRELLGVVLAVALLTLGVLGGTLQSWIVVHASNAPQEESGPDHLVVAEGQPRSVWAVPGKLPDGAVAAGDENWLPEFYLLGTNDAVDVLEAAPDGSLYIGGIFTLAGSAETYRIARCKDGQCYHMAGIMNGRVYAMAADDVGNLYVGGSFSSIDGVTVNRIARWDGSAWSAIGGGVSGRVNAVAWTKNDGLYVGGSFVEAGGNPVPGGLARWDGATWHEVGNPVTETVDQMVVDSTGNVFVVGYRDPGGHPFNISVAQWNGATWTILGDQSNVTIGSMVIDANGYLYIGGDFSQFDGVPASRIAKWNGTQWSTVGGGFPDGGGVSGLTMIGTQLFAAGTLWTDGVNVLPGVAMWDGATWSEVEGSRLESDFISEIESDIVGNLYVAGDFIAIGGKAASRIAKWRNGAWSSVVTGGNGLNRQPVVAMVSDSSGNVVVGGNFDTAGAVVASNIAQWDGESWTPLGSGTNSTVLALALDGAGNVYAGGSFTKAGGSDINGLAMWNGAQWSEVGSGCVGEIDELAVSDTGTAYTSGGYSLRRCDGASWTAVGQAVNGSLLGSFSALAVAANGDLYAGGEFTAIDSTPASYIARWDGTAWHALGTGLNGTVHALLIDTSGNVYAGGAFTTAGGSPAAGIAKWNGTAWSGFGSGVDGTVYAIGRDKAGNLYVGGNFTSAGGSPANKVARWDGTAWSSLGSGIDTTTVNTIGIDKNQVVLAGGTFDKAGGKLSSNIAGWVEPAAVYTVTVNTNGDGAGVVSSVPVGISCGTVCESGFTSGAQVEIVAAASSGSTFAGWDGACTGTGACTILVNRPRSVTATFTKSPAPTIIAGSPPATGQSVEFAATLGMSSYDTCTWDFGDSASAACTLGSADVGSASIQAITVRGSHTYTQTGDYLVKVTASNGAGTVSVETPFTVVEGAELFLPAVSR